MAQELPTPTRDEFGPLEPDEIEALEEERAEAREMERLTKDKQANYAMLRKLAPITQIMSIGALEFGRLYSSFEDFKRIMLFRQWHAIEGGEMQVRESTDMYDSHGYAVVRPKDDKKHDIYIRVWDGFPNSVIIMPKSDDPLPRQGRKKAEIMEKMDLISGKRLEDYMIWLERMRKVE